jgi:sulfate permease, SulP family
MLSHPKCAGASSSVSDFTGIFNPRPMASANSRIVTSINDTGAKVYEVHGPIFFASVHRFGELFDPEADKYTKAGKRLQLRHLSAECRGLLARAGDLVEVNISEDPHYHVADDRLA